MDKFIRLEQLTGEYVDDEWIAYHSNSTGCRGRKMGFQLCHGEFSAHFNVDGQRAVTLEVSSHKPHGLDWYKIVTADGQMWYWGDIKDCCASPWCYEVDQWLARHFGRKPVYVTCWADS